MITVLMRGLLAVMLASVNFGLHAQTLDQQERCASLALKTFNEEEASFVALKRSDLPPNFYDGHYNSKLDKCFLLVNRFTSYEGKYRHTIYLQDAIEKRTYAYYQKIEGLEKPGACWLPRTNMNYCNTREEFDEFVARYME